MMSTWFAQRILDLLGRLRDLYYRRKYGTIAQRLGRPDVGSDDQRRGFILLQIDGLSYDHLTQALAAGAMPTLSRLLAEGRLVAGPWRCGLPSTTPAAQAGLMFGNRYDIPGFRWYEKEHGRAVHARSPDQMQAVRDRVSRGHPGILQGGSCYASAFDGDASLALFTISTIHPHLFFESVRGFGLFLLFFLSPVRLLRILGLTTANYLARLTRHLVALVRPSVLNPLDVISPLVLAMGDAILREVQTFGVMLDIYRRVPAIYANYTGYDEVAHKVGPTHRAAFRVLRTLDKHIHQIYRMCERYRGREYDIYVISDHGNSPAVPFEWQNGVTLGQYIVGQVGQHLRVDEHADGHEFSADRTRYLLEEWEGLEQRLSPRLRQALARARLYVGRRLPHVEDPDYDPQRRQDIVVSASGPLAHVYFNASRRPLDLVEVVAAYPHLLDRLLSNPGIGVIVGRADERTIVLGQEGGMLVIGQEDGVREGPHPLAPFGDVAYAAAQLHQLAHFPHAGDLIVLGALGSDGRVVTFEKQVATHGGLGGPQLRPLVVWPPGCPLTPGTLQTPEDLYRHFSRHYSRSESRLQPVACPSRPTAGGGPSSERT